MPDAPLLRSACRRHYAMLAPTIVIIIEGFTQPFMIRDMPPFTPSLFSSLIIIVVYSVPRLCRRHIEDMLGARHTDDEAFIAFTSAFCCCAMLERQRAYADDARRAARHDDDIRCWHYAAPKIR